MPYFQLGGKSEGKIVDTASFNDDAGGLTADYLGFKNIVDRTLFNTSHNKYVKINSNHTTIDKLDNSLMDLISENENIYLLNSVDDVNTNFDNLKSKSSLCMSKQELEKIPLKNRTV